MPVTISSIVGTKMQAFFCSSASYDFIISHLLHTLSYWGDKTITANSKTWMALSENQKM